MTLRLTGCDSVAIPEGKLIVGVCGLDGGADKLFPTVVLA
jgi:hypothetical protein